MVLNQEIASDTITEKTLSNKAVMGPMTRKWEVGNDPKNKIWEVGDWQKKCGRCIFLKWEVGDEEINVGGGRWIKLLGGLLNGVKTHKL